MKQEFVTYEQALALKKLGFDMPVNWFVSVNDVDEIWEGGEYNWNGYTEDKNISLPLKQQVFRWFRNKHNILATVYSNASGYLYEWHDAIGGTHRGWSEYEGPNDSGVWDSYEEAESACIDKLIELVKSKQS